MKILFYVFIAIFSFSTFGLDVKVIDGSKVEYTCRSDDSLTSIKAKESWFCLIVNKNTKLVKTALAANAFFEFSKLTKDFFLTMPEQSKEVVTFHDLLDKVMNSKLIY